MIIIDNYLPKKIFTKIANDPHFFAPPTNTPGNTTSQHGLADNNEQPRHYYFWTPDQPATTLRQQTVKHIAPLIHQPNTLGYEYWTRTFTPGQHLDPHIDQDLYGWNLHQTFNPPAIGAIWYGPNTCEGGNLQIWDTLLTENDLKNGKNCPQNPCCQQTLCHQNLQNTIKNTPTTQIKPTPNRLIIFNSGHQPHSVTTITKGTRQALTINLWTTHNPPAHLNNYTQDTPTH